MYTNFVDSKKTKNFALYAAIFLSSAIAAIYIFNPYFWGWGYPLKLLSVYKVWYGVLAPQAATMEAAWGIDRTGQFIRGVFFKYSNFPFEWMLLSCGMVLFSMSLIYSLFTKRFYFRNVLFLIFFINYLFIFAFMKMNRDRYYLPTIIAGKFIVAGMFYYAASLPYKYFFTNRTPKKRV